jgi:Ca2+-binding EF-hand superfamily protein
MGVYKLLPKIICDLEFSKCNTGKVINFTQFVRILHTFAKRFSPSMKSEEAFDHFARQQIIANLRASPMQTEINSAKLLAVQPGARRALAAHSAQMQQVFKAYKRSSPETSESIHLNDFLLFLNQFSYIPDVLSTTQAAEFFRTVQHFASFDDFINKPQFEQCVFLMALWGSNAELVEDRISRWFKYLEVNQELLRNVELQGAHSHYPSFPLD